MLYFDEIFMLVFYFFSWVNSWLHAHFDPLYVHLYTKIITYFCQWAYLPCPIISLLLIIWNLSLVPRSMSFIQQTLVSITPSLTSDFLSIHFIGYKILERALSDLVGLATRSKVSLRLPPSVSFRRLGTLRSANRDHIVSSLHGK